MPRTLPVFFAVSLALAVLPGCGGGEKQKPLGDEPTKYQSQAGLEQLSHQAAQQAALQMGKGAVKENKGFKSALDLQAKAAEVKDLDALIRPVLKNVFGDARIISESSGPETRKDGEVIENKFSYALKRVVVPADGETLHAALRAKGFAASPRLGRKPTILSTGAMMSLMRTTSRRGYSLVIKVDSVKQRIEVESYKLGSKYDRLM